MFRITSLLIAGAAFTCASAARADVVSYTQLGTGSTAALTNYNAAATGGNFVQKDFDGVSGVGVGGGSVDGEIDGNEKITFTSTAGTQLLTSFTVAFLYAANQFGDNVNEFAQVTLGGGPTLVLEVDTTGSATLTGSSGYTITNTMNAGAVGGGGYWTVNLTNALAFNSLEFGTVAPNGGADAAHGDYAFVNFTTAVPEPSTWAMMMLGFAGLGFLTYRRRQLTADLAA